MWIKGLNHPQIEPVSPHEPVIPVGLNDTGHTAMIWNRLQLLREEEVSLELINTWHVLPNTKLTNKLTALLSIFITFYNSFMFAGPEQSCFYFWHWNLFLAVLKRGLPTLLIISLSMNLLTNPLQRVSAFLYSNNVPVPIASYFVNLCNEQGGVYASEIVQRLYLIWQSARYSRHPPIF